MPQIPAQVPVHTMVTDHPPAVASPAFAGAPVLRLGWLPREPEEGPHESGDLTLGGAVMFLSAVTDKLGKDHPPAVASPAFAGGPAPRLGWSTVSRIPGCAGAPALRLGWLFGFFATDDVEIKSP